MARVFTIYTWIADYLIFGLRLKVTNGGHFGKETLSESLTTAESVCPDRSQPYSFR